MLRASSSIYLQQLWQRPSLQTTSNEANKSSGGAKQSSGDQDDDLTSSSLDFPPPPIPPKHGDHSNATNNDYDDLSIIVLHPEPGIANARHGYATPSTSGRRQTKSYHFLYQDCDSSSSSAGTASLPPTPTLPCAPPIPSQSTDIAPKVGLLRRESSRLSLKRKNLTRKLKRAMSFTKPSTSGSGKRPSSSES